MSFGAIGNVRTGMAVFSIALLSPLLCYASDNYGVTFSGRLRGYELSEEGVRAALEHFDDLDLFQARAAIATVGEQHYVGLVDELKAIYHRRPEDVDMRHADRYRGLLRDFFQGYIARSLVLCEDAEAEKIALELVMRTPEMGIVEASYAVRNLKFLVKHFGTDLSNVFEFLINQHTNLSDRPPYGQLVVRELIPELHEIERYTRMTNHPTANNYAQAIARCSELVPSNVKYLFDRAKTARSRWGVNLILEKAQAQAALPAP